MPAQWGEHILWSFGSSIGGRIGDGANPSGGLLADSAGNLYGVTNGGGGNVGTVFELSPPTGQSTQWTEQLLWGFGLPDDSSGDTLDGSNPIGGLIADAAGNLYGVTTGGSFDSIVDEFRGAGTVFRLNAPGQIPPSSDPVLEAPFTQWTEQVLWEFNTNYDGGLPMAGLIADNSGHLYGTTTAGGTNAPRLGGTVFEITLP